MTGAKPRRIGLARALSKLGHCSRARGFELVRAGKVKVNGTLRRDPEYPVRLEQDRVAVDGEKILSEEKIYLMMNKARGMVTSASDEKGRKTVYACLPEGLPWVGPVGRLDKASEGLLLFTNDSEWAARILAPETHLAKTYHVQTRGQVNEEILALLRSGVKAREGDLLRARKVSVIRKGERNTWLEIVLDEGKTRHIRRMLLEVDIQVLRLVRTALGPLHLGNLAKGGCRPLAPDEKRALERTMRELIAKSG
jgi:23S rRNA pseudouridine2605 synthase